jgi:hypothetical protein
MTRTMRALCLVPAGCLLGAWAAVDSARGEPPLLSTYQASYDVEYKGRRLGSTDFALTHDDAAEIYEFESRTTARGVVRLLRPNPAIERSRFKFRDGVIQPLAFHFEDGSRRGDDNLDITFDWQAGTASVTSANGVAEFSLQPGVLDRASLQAALMHDLEHRREPGPYVLVDGDSLKTYRYSPGERRAIRTPAGRFDALALTQVREGSSRTTVLWVAPDLNYLPIKIDQYRDGEVQTSLTLTSYTGFGA